MILPVQKNDPQPEAARAVQRQMSGGSILLAGKMLSIGLNFAAQVLMVGFLAKGDYGAFAYALSLIACCQAFSSLGLKTAIPRFVPIYQEQGRFAELYGLLVLILGVILLVGLAVVSFFFFAPASLPASMIAPAALPLLPVLCILVPLEALDLATINLFASFGKSSAIFFRKHLLGPGLKLTAVLALRAFNGDIVMLAYGYLAASALGTGVSIWALGGVLRSEGLLKHLSWRAIRIPVREAFSFSIPALSSDLVPTVMHSFNILLLGFLRGTQEVALYAVVFPAARLNRIVLSSMTVLFTPNAARLLARRDYSAINRLYWQTTLWISALSFPVFALTFFMAGQLVEQLYGSRYAESEMLLSILALGYYFNVLLGCNSHTLKVFRRMRFLLAGDLLTMLASLGLNLLLIPQWGALGAAVSTASAMIFHNLLRQFGLRQIAQMRAFDKEQIGFYLLIAGCSLGLFAIRQWGGTDLVVSSLLVAAASALVLAFSRKRLQIGSVFPQLLKVPLLRSLCA